jgi:hypothetical protein
MTRPQLEVAEIFRRFGPAWRAANEGHLSRAQRRVMRAIELCRTAELGGHVEQCEACAHTRIAYNSCRNRHCPKCQWSAAQAWLDAREAELLPVPYFHLVFTLPAALGALAYQNKAKLYGLLLKAAAETLTTIAADPKHLGAKIGVTAVLHSWGQSLDHHPHVHCIVPAGGISLDGRRWIACRSPTSASSTAARPRRSSASGSRGTRASSTPASGRRLILASCPRPCWSSNVPRTSRSQTCRRTDDVLGCLREVIPTLTHPQRPAPLPAAARHLPPAAG